MVMRECGDVASRTRNPDSPEERPNLLLPVDGYRPRWRTISCASPRLEFFCTSPSSCLTVCGRGREVVVPLVLLFRLFLGLIRRLGLAPGE